MIDIVIGAQTAGFIFVSVASLWFLAYYFPSHDRSSPFARFVVSLNLTIAIVGLVFVVGSIYERSLVMEGAKAVMLVVLGLVMLKQLSLLSIAQSESGHEKAPTPPPKGQDRG